MPERDEPADRPGPVEATALAIAGPAFAASLIVLRGSAGLEPEVFDAGAVILATAGLGSWVHRKWGAPAATLLRGGGLALAAIVLAPSLVAPFFSAVAPVVVAIVAGTLLQANARRERPTAALDSAGIATLGVAFAFGLIVSSDFPEPGRLRLTLVVVLGVTVVGLALRRFAIEKGRGDLAPMPLGLLLVATLGGVYLSYRTLVREHVENLPLYEWSLAALAASLVLARLRRRAKERETSDAWTAIARRHAQDVRPVYDERMGPVAAAVGRYLERGDGYDAYRQTMLRAAGDAPPPALIAALDRAPRAAAGRTRASRRESARARLHAHEDVLSRLTTSRGP